MGSEGTSKAGGTTQMKDRFCQLQDVLDEPGGGGCYTNETFTTVDLDDLSAHTGFDQAAATPDP
ncbi:unnamed protein product [Coregonus sp. 'balchen']|nr:unnamed protein product [Coregonus sp. 'balchen']